MYPSERVRHRQRGEGFDYSVAGGGDLAVDRPPIGRVSG